jgi:hypothetical protein
VSRPDTLRTGGGRALTFIENRLAADFGNWRIPNERTGPRLELSW